LSVTAWQTFGSAIAVLEGAKGVPTLIKIYVARHGETTWNAEMRIQGRSDPGLTPKGEAQSLALLERLKDQPISAVYTSTLQRSIRTAEPMALHLGLVIQKQPELDEINFGILEGKTLSDMDEMTRKEWEKFRSSRLQYHVPGAESYLDVVNRLRPFVESLLKDHQDQEILIVGHRAVNRMLIGLLLDYPLEEAVRIEQGNNCVYIIERNGTPTPTYFTNGEIKEGLVFEGNRVVRPLRNDGQ
jgi:broad specificity phosphatase PhoE